jgi:hypothetical protein
MGPKQCRNGLGDALDGLTAMERREERMRGL